MLPTERCPNQVMEENRVFLCVLFCGHQFGSPAKTAVFIPSRLDRLFARWTSFSRNAIRVGSEEGRVFSQATIWPQKDFSEANEEISIFVHVLSFECSAILRTGLSSFETAHC